MMMPLLCTTDDAEWHLYFLIINKEIPPVKKYSNFHSIRHKILPGLSRIVSTPAHPKKQNDADFFDNM